MKKKSRISYTVSYKTKLNGRLATVKYTVSYDVINATKLVKL